MLLLVHARIKVTMVVERAPEVKRTLLSTNFDEHMLKTLAYLNHFEHHKNDWSCRELATSHCLIT